MYTFCAVSLPAPQPLISEYIHALKLTTHCLSSLYVFNFYLCPIFFLIVIVNFRLLVSGDSVILLFAPEDVIQNCAAFLVSGDAGVILSSEGVMPYFRMENTNVPNLFKLPSAIVLVTSDG